MCHRCEEEGNEEDPPDWRSLPAAEQEDFFDYACNQMSIIINKAEEHGVLHDLITTWPRPKVVAFEMSTAMLDAVLTDEGE